jgi:hypothetical protein
LVPRQISTHVDQARRRRSRIRTPDRRPHKGPGLVGPGLCPHTLACLLDLMGAVACAPTIPAGIRARRQYRSTSFRAICRFLDSYAHLSTGRRRTLRSTKAHRPIRTRRCRFKASHQVVHWKADLDALVTETWAFTGTLIDSVTQPCLQPRETIQRIGLGGSPEREEIRKRIETFRAHQRRFNREREDYAASVIRNMRSPKT